MEKYLKIETNFIKHLYSLHLGLIVIFCLCSGGFVSFSNLLVNQSAKVMEMYVIFVGIMLFIPLFISEQDTSIWYLLKSKAVPMWKHYITRLIPAILILMGIIGIFEMILYKNHSMFPIWDLWIGAFSETLFLGSIGFFISAVTNQVILGYMVSIIYYGINIGNNNFLNKFALFQMSKGQYDFWGYMLVASVLLIICGIVIREWNSRK